MASTPALMANMSARDLCLPLGLMHPNERGVRGNINRAIPVTLAISIGSGGFTLAIAVPRIGINAMITRADGLTEETIWRA